MKERDKRTSLMGQFLNAVLVTKLMVLEDWLYSQTQRIRDDELQLQWKKIVVNLFNFVMVSGGPVLTVLLAFTAFTLMNPNRTLTPATAFTTIIWFDRLGQSLRGLPWLIRGSIDTLISFDRLRQYFLLREVDPQRMLAPAPPAGPRGDMVAFKDCSFSWNSGGGAGDGEEDLKADEGEQICALKQLNFSVKQGEFVVVVGPVGSGKTSVLHAILGNMTQLSGKRFLASIGGQGVRKVPATIVGQTPWLEDKTVRENVTRFGKPDLERKGGGWVGPIRSGVDERRYLLSLQVCDLVEEVKRLPKGDMTLVGEGGRRLSGGQRQRLALARSVYSDVELYLLDDVLSAVDARVAQIIFRECIVKMLRNKTRILVTHQLQFAKSPHVDRIVALNESGQCLASGRYADVQQDIKRLMSKENKIHLTDNTALQSKGNQCLEGELTDAGDIKRILDSKLTTKMPALRYQMEDLVPENQDTTNYDRKHSKNEFDERVEAQNDSFGYVSFEHVKFYGRGLGACSLWMAFFWLTLAQICNVMTTVWLSYWTAKKSSSPFYLWIFAVFSVSTIVFQMIVYLCLGLGSIRASHIIHDKMLLSVLRAPLSFFDTHPVGKSLNRFTSDVAKVDETLSGVLFNVLTIIFGFLGIMVVIGLKSPLTLLALVPLGIPYYYTSELYRWGSRDLRRLDSKLRSPILSHFAEMVSGMTVIQAHDAVEMYQEENLGLLSTNARSFIAYWGANQWVTCLLELMGSIFVLAATLFVIYESAAGNMSSATSALIITYALELPGLVNGFVRCYANAEMQFVAVERISEFCRIEPEPGTSESRDENPPKLKPIRKYIPVPQGHSINDHSSQTKPLIVTEELDVPEEKRGSVDNDEWRERRLPMSVDFNGVHLSYIGSKGVETHALRGLTFQITPGHKIAIVGRTGAGKSSLCLAIARAYAFRGVVRLDGVDVMSLSLHQLRSSIGYIPQNPVFFNGTVFENLFLGMVEETTRTMNGPTTRMLETAWRSLKQVGMAEKIRRLPKGIHTVIQEGGSNLSAGEKQLVCLARALCRESGLLICDEPTANVDISSDKTIHDVLFNLSTTVMVICHRLDQIQRFDKVILLDRGRVGEYGTPETMLQNPQGQLTGLMREYKRGTASP
eukprot:CAMPEP_0114503760 /NCGR_PEP_ID=MMETSP0109-20121206/9826_1 /TAXON_ID=29199 /ORGANISM="Chlorarachnion reptans, Strain CCCM449" /LENGTH=1134 /DNA_ID=CAMNT_0001681823 /DNA_START=152 /DNA_END=3556 /DNA_ORIENTATION=-